LSGDVACGYRCVFGRTVVRPFFGLGWSGTSCAEGGVQFTMNESRQPGPLNTAISLMAEGLISGVRWMFLGAGFRLNATAQAGNVNAPVACGARNLCTRPYRCFAAIPLVMSLLLLMCGCGAGRNPGMGKDDSPRYRYDQELELRLEEIIPGPLGVAQLVDPVSVAVTAGGELAILERKVPRLVLLDTNRQVVREVGGFGLGPAQLREPRFVRSGFGLTLNVADLGGRLLIYDWQLRFLDSFEPAYEASGFPAGSPSGLAVAMFGDTYLADRDNDVVYHFDPGGKFVETIGGADAGPGRLTRPEGLAVTGDGKLIVCDTDAQRVVVFDRAGEYLESVGEGELPGPVAVALTPDEQAFFVGGPQSPHLALYSLEGQLLVSWDGRELAPGGFGALADLVVADSFLYIVDSGNKRVLKFRLVPAVE